MNSSWTSSPLLLWTGDTTVSLICCRWIVPILLLVCFLAAEIIFFLHSLEKFVDCKLWLQSYMPNLFSNTVVNHSCICVSFILGLAVFRVFHKVAKIPVLDASELEMLRSSGSSQRKSVTCSWPVWVHRVNQKLDNVYVLWNQSANKFYNHRCTVCRYCKKNYCQFECNLIQFI